MEDKRDDGVGIWREARADGQTAASMDIRATTDAPPPRALMRCSGDVSSYVSEDRESPEVNMVGIYDSETGQVAVRVDRREPMILVLSSYENVTWDVTAASNAHIVRVILNGYERSTVRVPVGVPVDSYSFAGSSDSLGCSPYVWPLTRDCDARAVAGAITKKTAKPLTSFWGCYRASEVVFL